MNARPLLVSPRAPAGAACVFNRGNQAEGTQQRALAGSVAMFAEAPVNHPGRLPYHRLKRGLLVDGVRVDQHGATSDSARGVRPEIVWRDWEVTDKTPETEDVVTFGSGGFVTGPCGPRCRAST